MVFTSFMVVDEAAGPAGMAGGADDAGAAAAGVDATAEEIAGELTGVMGPAALAALDVAGAGGDVAGDLGVVAGDGDAAAVRDPLVHAATRAKTATPDSSSCPRRRLPALITGPILPLAAVNVRNLLVLARGTTRSRTSTARDRPLTPV
jgi:hypothetical protein